ncbi:hypothetical protein FIM43_04570 [Helicobacter pylori]|nr:hypothetical protein FIM43_04570 [Helicobacter pylori]
MKTFCIQTLFCFFKNHYFIQNLKKSCFYSLVGLIRYNPLYLKSFYKWVLQWKTTKTIKS